MHLETDNALIARDRSVTLMWQYVHPVLNRVAGVKRNATMYQENFGASGYNVTFIGRNGSIELGLPLFCSGECGAVKTTRCRPC